MMKTIVTNLIEDYKKSASYWSGSIFESVTHFSTDYKGKFGLIAPYSKDFCKTCNRLRITSRGDLRLCLFGNTGINIRHLMQRDDQLEELKDLILKQLNFKKESHYLELGETGLTNNLSTTGG